MRVWLIAWMVLVVGQLAPPTVVVSLAPALSSCIEAERVAREVEAQLGRPVSVALETREPRADAYEVRVRVDQEGEQSARVMRASERECGGLAATVAVVAATLIEAELARRHAALRVRGMGESPDSDDAAQVMAAPTEPAGDSGPRVPGVPATQSAVDGTIPTGGRRASRIAAGVGVATAFSLLPRPAVRLSASAALKAWPRGQLELHAQGVLPANLERSYVDRDRALATSFELWAVGLEGVGCATLAGQWSQRAWLNACGRLQALALHAAVKPGAVTAPTAEFAQAAAATDWSGAPRWRGQLALGAALELGYKPGTHECWHWQRNTRVTTPLEDSLRSATTWRSRQRSGWARPPGCVRPRASCSPARMLKPTEATRSRSSSRQNSVVWRLISEKRRPVVSAKTLARTPRSRENARERATWRGWRSVTDADPGDRSFAMKTWASQLFALLSMSIAGCEMATELGELPCEPGGECLWTSRESQLDQAEGGPGIGSIEAEIMMTLCDDQTLNYAVRRAGAVVTQGAIVAQSPSSPERFGLGFARYIITDLEAGDEYTLEVSSPSSGLKTESEPFTVLSNQRASAPLLLTCGSVDYGFVWAKVAFSPTCKGLKPLTYSYEITFPAELLDETRRKLAAQGVGEDVTSVLKRGRISGSGDLPDGASTVLLGSSNSPAGSGYTIRARVGACTAEATFDVEANRLTRLELVARRH